MKAAIISLGSVSSQWTAEEMGKLFDSVDMINLKKVEVILGDENVELLGTVVSVFDPNFFEVCPECKKRAKAGDNGYVCQTHGNVDPEYSYVMNAVIDDGTDSIRSVLFRENANEFLTLTYEEMMNIRDNTGEFQKLKEPTILFLYLT